MTDTLAELREVQTGFRRAVDEIMGAGIFTIGFVMELEQALSTLDKIISEYQSPLAWLDKPETVEEVARAMDEYLRINNFMALNHARWILLTKAAISTIKRLAGGDITAMQNQKEDE